MVCGDHISAPIDVIKWRTSEYRTRSLVNCSCYICQGVYIILPAAYLMTVYVCYTGKLNLLKTACSMQSSIQCDLSRIETWADKLMANKWLYA